MTRIPTCLLIACGVLAPMRGAQAAPLTGSGEAPLVIAQAADGTDASPTTPDPAAGGNGAPAPGAGASGASNAASPGTAAATGATSSSAARPTQPNPTGATRNGAARLPTLAEPATGASGSLDSSISYGGPRVDTQPVYGSTLRDNGGGNNGTPTYSSAPGTLGGPINGTANSYYATLPNGAVAPGQAATNGRGVQVGNVNPSLNQQPLGGAAYTRDQTGTFGGRAGYNAQGIYNGTAAQTGVGYGSTYATSGRPTGGLLSTGVDATGPLRPFIPQNTGIIGRPNSGYGVPNGSRSTHMDARGIQRVD